MSKPTITIWLVPTGTDLVNWENEFAFWVDEKVVAVAVVPVSLGWKLEDIVLDDLRQWMDDHDGWVAGCPEAVLDLLLVAHRGDDENHRHVVRFNAEDLRKLQERFEVTVERMRN